MDLKKIVLSGTIFLGLGIGTIAGCSSESATSLPAERDPAAEQKAKYDKDWLYGLVIKEGGSIIDGRSYSKGRGDSLEIGTRTYVLQIEINEQDYFVQVENSNGTLDALEMAIEPGKTNVSLNKSAFNMYRKGKIVWMRDNDIIVPADSSSQPPK